jgi:hypothetical protein
MVGVKARVEALGRVAAQQPVDDAAEHLVAVAASASDLRAARLDHRPDGRVTALEEQGRRGRCEGRDGGEKG